MRTVFLTGATGFVGGALGRLLLSRGFTVKAAVRGSSKADRVPKGCEVVRVDFLDPDSMVPHLKGMDVIQHVAGAVKARCQEEFDRANAASTAALVKAANTACPGARFILTSSQAAAGPCGTGPVTAYGRSKLLAERAVTGFYDYTIIRPPAVFGPGDEATKKLFKWAGRGFFASPNTKGAFCAVFVDDLAELMLKVMDHPETRGRVLQPSYPERITWKAFHRALQRAAGRKILHVKVPKKLVHFAGAMSEALSVVTGACPMVTRDKARELTSGEWVLKQDEVAGLLGWQPRVPLEEALRRSLGSDSP
ncbi:MAG: NAD-dependent epimerase/dehydratase family protein [Candidatus Fermentibacteraceae bacterium]